MNEIQKVVGDVVREHSQVPITGPLEPMSLLLACVSNKSSAFDHVQWEVQCIAVRHATLERDVERYEQQSTWR